MTFWDKLQAIEVSVHFWPFWWRLGYNRDHGLRRLDFGPFTFKLWTAE